METGEISCLSLLEQLPLELIEVIAQYLSAKDVGACCATSREMRELFGNDAIWRPRCTKDLGEYLMKTPCKVQPGFISPVSKNSTLSPVSKWRMLFMYENHLWNNWRQGKYVQEEIAKRNSSYYWSEFDMFLNNDCVISKFYNRVELLDVRGYPPVNATIPVSLESHISEKLKIKVVDDQMIILYKTFVQVYQPDLITKQCPLKHAFVLEDSVNESIKTSNDQKFVFDKSYPFRRVLHAAVGKFFVGVIEGQSTMHIWDINSGVKLKEQVCPIKSFTIQDIGASSSTMNLVLTARKNQDLSVTFLAYSLTKLAYLPFKETFDGSIQFVMNNNLVAIWNNKSMNVLNYETSDLLLKNEPAQSPPKVLRNVFIFCNDRKLRIFNPSTRLCEYLDLEGIDWYEILSSKFLHIQREHSLEMWEIGNTVKDIKKTSLELHFNTCSFFLNEACTRYIVRYASGNVVSFW